MYKGVKSKVNANHKSIKKAQKRDAVREMGMSQNFNPNDTIKSIIDKSQAGYGGDGDLLERSQNITRAASPGSYQGVTLTGMTSQTRIARTFKQENQKDMMSMI